MRHAMRQKSKQEGSALMFALLAIVFLTVIGLALAMVTETEMLIGANEQVSQETFIAAESGTAVAFNNMLVNNDSARNWFAIHALTGDQPRKIEDRQIGYIVDYSDIYPVIQSCAPYSDCTQPEDDTEFSYYFVTRARARRLAWPESQATPNCESEKERDADAVQTLDYFNHIQAEKTIDMGFYAAPLGEITGYGLEATFQQADVFGCDPEPDYEDYIQKVN